jgi:hypothetical protein
MSGESRALAWWSVAQRLCAQLSSPTTDLEVADREVEALWRASWLTRRGTGSVGSCQAAWLDSRCRRVVQWLVSRPS